MVGCEKYITQTNPDTHKARSPPQEPRSFHPFAWEGLVMVHGSKDDANVFKPSLPDSCSWG